MADVQSGEAHLSENKKNIFSEFTIQVNKAYKALTAIGVLGDSLAQPPAH
jgi:hypothetical protein